MKIYPAVLMILLIACQQQKPAEYKDVAHIWDSVQVRKTLRGEWISVRNPAQGVAFEFLGMPDVEDLILLKTSLDPMDSRVGNFTLERHGDSLNPMYLIITSLTTGKHAVGIYRLTHDTLQLIDTKNYLSGTYTRKRTK